jgi:hypothetical protein
MRKESLTMRKNYERVLDCWRRQKACKYKNPRGSEPVYTDGNTLFSYNDRHPFVHRDDEGHVFVLAPHMDEPGSTYVSATTGTVVRDIVHSIFRRDVAARDTVCVKSFKAMEHIVDGQRPANAWFACPGLWAPPDWYARLLTKRARETQKPILGRGARRRRCKGGRYC